MAAAISLPMEIIICMSNDTICTLYRNLERQGSIIELLIYAFCNTKSIHFSTIFASLSNNSSPKQFREKVSIVDLVVCAFSKAKSNHYWTILNP